MHFSWKEGPPQVNHLCFADDIILFTSRSAKSLKLIMITLRTYEDTSGKLIKSKKRHSWFIKMCLTRQKSELKESLDLNKRKGLPIT